MRAWKSSKAHQQLAKRIFGELSLHYGKRFQTYDTPQLAVEATKAYLKQISRYEISIVEEAIDNWMFIDQQEWPPSPMQLGIACKQLVKKHKQTFGAPAKISAPWPEGLPKPAEEDISKAKENFKNLIATLKQNSYR